MSISKYVLLFVIGQSLFAMDKFHEPSLSIESSKMIHEQLKIDELCLKDTITDGAKKGLVMPWLCSFLVGIYLGDKIGDRGRKGEIFENTLDGFISALCLAPISLALSVTMPIPCMGYGATKYIFDKVKADIHREAFELAVTAHLYQWITLAKLQSLSNGNQQQSQQEILSAKQWRRLEKRLISFVAHELLPQMSSEDIREYLHMAINLFVSKNSNNLLILKRYADV